MTNNKCKDNIKILKRSANTNNMTAVSLKTEETLEKRKKNLNKKKRKNKR